MLGLSWFIKHNPNINWLLGTVNLLSEDTHEPVIIKSTSRIFELEEDEPMDSLAAFYDFWSTATGRFGSVETWPLMLLAMQQDARPSQDVQDLIKTALPEFRKVLAKFSSLFMEDLPTGLSKRRDVHHAIDTGDAKRINTQDCQLNPQQLQEQQKQIKPLLQLGLDRESSSPWGSLVLFVPKIGGEWRMCVDSRAVNEITVKNGQPLPRVQDCLDALAGAL
jgi:hypothetical protein